MHINSIIWCFISPFGAFW